METVLRGVVTYLFVWFIFRIAGKRSLAQITTFDAVLLLIISETVQSSLIDEDNSMTNAFVLILTILGFDVLLSCIKQRFPAIEHVVDGVPLVLMDEKGLDEEVLEKERVDKDDILAAAREQQGLATLEEIEYAVLEQSGGISVIPKRN